MSPAWDSHGRCKQPPSSCSSCKQRPSNGEIIVLSSDHLPLLFEPMGKGPFSPALRSRCPSKVFGSLAAFLKPIPD